MKRKKNEKKKFFFFEKKIKNKKFKKPFTPVGVTNRGKRPPTIYKSCQPTPLLIPLTLEDIEGVRGVCAHFFPLLCTRGVR